MVSFRGSFEATRKAPTRVAYTNFRVRTADQYVSSTAVGVPTYTVSTLCSKCRSEACCIGASREWSRFSPRASSDDRYNYASLYK